MACKKAMLRSFGALLPLVIEAYVTLSRASGTNDTSAGSPGAGPAAERTKSRQKCLLSLMLFSRAVMPAWEPLGRVIGLQPDLGVMWGATWVLASAGAS